jgi:acyl carrier protein
MSGDLQLIPDWPRVRQLVAKRLRKSEIEIDQMMTGEDSLEKVELAMAIEEALEDPRLKK